MKLRIICTLCVLVLSFTGFACSKTTVLKRDVPLREQLIKPNTKYVIKWDYELKDELKIPDNCCLVFKGGSINGSGSVNGNNTVIKAKIQPIFGKNISVIGTWKVKEVYPEWFEAKGDGLTDDAQSLFNTFSLADKAKAIIHLSPLKTYYYNKRIGSCLLGKQSYLNVKGNNAEIKIGKIGDYEYIFRCVAPNSFSRIENLTLTLDDNNRITAETGNEKLGTRRTEFSLGGVTGILGVVEIDNVTINNAVGVWQFDLEAATGFLRNSTINWSRTQPATYDRTSIYLNCKDFEVSGNTLNGSDYAHTGIEFHGDEIRVHDNIILNYDVSVDFVNDVEKLGINKIIKQELYNNYIETRNGVYLWTQNINNVDVDTVRISGNTIITTGSSNNDFSSCIAIYNVVGSNAHFKNLIVENNTLEQKGEEVYPIIDLACTRTGSELSILQHVLIRGNVIKVGNSNSVIKLEGNAANFQIQNISFENNIVYCNSSNNLVFGGYDNVDCYKKILVKDCEFKNKRLELFRVHNARVSLMSTNNTYSSDQRGK